MSRRSLSSFLLKQRREIIYRRQYTAGQKRPACQSQAPGAAINSQKTPDNPVAADRGKFAGVGGIIAGVAVYFASVGGNQKEKE